MHDDDNDKLSKATTYDFQQWTNPMSSHIPNIKSLTVDDTAIPNYSLTIDRCINNNNINNDNNDDDDDDDELNKRY